MERFLQSIEIALRNEDWYGALSTALTMPDICAKIENPGCRGRKRYKQWYEQWLMPTHTVVDPNGEQEIFLSAEDCYGLRCSYLHEGGGELDREAKHSLERFHFITPPKWGVMHRNRINNVLQLQVDIFCREMINACRAWQKWIEESQPDKIKNMDNLLVIHDSANGVNI